MATTPMPPPPDPGNVQGMVLRGYTHPYSCHMLLTFTGRPGAAAFIGAPASLCAIGAGLGRQQACVDAQHLPDL
jgi:hypothetical protein